MRRHRAAKGKQMFEPAEIHKLLAAAGPTMRHDIAGANCGFGNADCGKLPMEALNLDTGWVDFPRPKTGVLRRCWLWPETVEAIRAAMLEPPRAEGPGRRRPTVHHQVWLELAKDTRANPMARSFASWRRMPA